MVSGCMKKCFCFLGNELLAILTYLLWVSSVLQMSNKIML